MQFFFYSNKNRSFVFGLAETWVQRKEWQYGGQNPGKARKPSEARKKCSFSEKREKLQEKTKETMKDDERAGYGFSAEQTRGPERRSSMPTAQTMIERRSLISSWAPLMQIKGDEMINVIQLSSNLQLSRRELWAVQAVEAYTQGELTSMSNTTDTWENRRLRKAMFEKMWFVSILKSPRTSISGCSVCWGLCEWHQGDGKYQRTFEAFEGRWVESAAPGQRAGHVELGEK